MLHQYVSGCAPGVQLFICGFATCKILPSFSILIFFFFHAIFTSCHSAILRSAVAKALVCLFAKRHTRKYNFKQWPEVINLIPFYGPPGCSHETEGKFQRNGHTCHFKDSPNKDCLEAAHFWKGTERKV